MKKVARWVSLHPKRAVGIIIVITLIMGYFTTSLQQEMSIEGLFPDYPEVRVMEGIQKDFGNSEMVAVIVQGEDVLTPEYFKKTAEVTERIWKDDIVSGALTEPKTDSISSLPQILAMYSLSLKGVRDPSMEQILNEMRSFESKEEINRTLSAFMEDPNVPEVMKEYSLVFLPKGFNEKNMKSERMLIYISLNGSLPVEELKKVELRIESIATGVDANFLTYGFQLLNYYWIKTWERLVPAFLITLISILLLMILNFRRLIDVIISLVTLFLATVWTFGLAGILGWKVDFMAGMVPILVLGLGIDFSFHVLMGYREHLQKTFDPRRSVYLVLSTVGIALLLAMVTTVAGFSSNGISDIPSMRHFGFLSAFSILSVFLLNMTFVPAVRELFDLKHPPSLRGPEKEKPGKSRTVMHLIRIIKRQRVAVVVLIIIFAIALPGWTLGLEMKASYDPTGELATDMNITKAYKILNTDFDVGTETVFIRVDGNLTNPLLWKELENAVENMNNDRYVVTYNGKARVEWILSLIPLLVTEDPNLAEVYLSIDRDMDGKIDPGTTSEQLKAFLNALYTNPMGRRYIHQNEEGDFDSLLITVATRTKLGYHGKELLSELKEDFRNVDANISFTGMPIIWAKGLDDIRDSMMKSLFLCLAFAFLVLPVAFGIYHRSPMLGLMTAIPPFITLGWLFITMRLLGIPLNMMTAMVGAIIVGIGIDYPIHIANRWALERKAGKSPEECYEISLSTTGKEVLYSAITTLISFGVFVILPIPVISQFAVTTLFGLIYSFIGAVFTLPLLLRVFWHRG